MDGSRSSHESGGRKVVSQASVKKRSTKEDKGSPEEKVKLSSIPDSKNVPIEISGNLHKQGRLLKKWKPRFFQIQGNCLYYFKNYEKKECLGLIDLQKCYYAGKSTTAASFGCAFELQTWGRTHLLAARDEREAERWISIMKKKMAPEARDRDKKGTKGDIDATIPSEMRTRRATIKMSKSNKKGSMSPVTGRMKPSASAHEMQMSKLTSLGEEEYEDMDVKKTPEATGGVTASQSVPEFKSNNVNSKDEFPYDAVKDETGKQTAPYDPVTPGANNSESQPVPDSIPEYVEEYIQKGAPTTSVSTDYEEMQHGSQQPAAPMKVPPWEHQLQAQMAPEQQPKRAPPPPRGANPPARGAPPPPPQPIRVPPSQPEEQPPPPPKRGASFKQPPPQKPPEHQQGLPDPSIPKASLPPPITLTQPPLYDTPPQTQPPDIPPKTQPPLYDIPPQTQPPNIPPKTQPPLYNIPPQTQPLYDTPPVMDDIPLNPIQETPPLPTRDFDDTPSPPKRTASLSRHGNNNVVLRQPASGKKRLPRQAMSVADIQLPPLISDDTDVTSVPGFKRSLSVTDTAGLPPLLDPELFNFPLPQEGAHKQGNEYTAMDWSQPVANNEGGTALLPPNKQGNEYTTMDWSQPVASNEGGTGSLPPLDIDLGNAELPPIIEPQSEPLPSTSIDQQIQHGIADMQLLPPDMHGIGTAGSTNTESMLPPATIEPPLPTDAPSNQQNNVADIQLLPPDMTTSAGTIENNISPPPTQNIADFSAFDLPPLDSSSSPAHISSAPSNPPIQNIPDFSAFDLPPLDSSSSPTHTSPTPSTLPPLSEIPELSQDEQLQQLPPTIGVEELRQRLPPPPPLASINDIPSSIDQLRYLLANDPQQVPNGSMRHRNIQLPPEDKPWLTEQTGVEQLRRFLTINST